MPTKSTCRQVFPKSVLCQEARVNIECHVELLHESYKGILIMIFFYWILIMILVMDDVFRN
jgi:hypothetical protein